MEPTVHRSVLMQEVLDGLNLSPSDVVVDATVNGGGHASEITKHLSDTGVFIGIDLDSSAIALSSERLKNAQCQVELVNDSFKNIDTILHNLELKACDKVLFDLGWSSNQFEKAERGFSFQLEGPLLMTLSDSPDTQAFTAYDIINTWEPAHIIDILEGYGEERYAWKITQGIIQAREIKPIVSTTELVEVINQSVPLKYRNGKIHPATKTFQALRIAVNNEMEVLKEGLKKAYEALSPNGRILVISFHSIEDRIVKNYFKQLANEGLATVLTKKPLVASEEELSENRRSRSAKLRIIQKI